MASREAPWVIACPIDPPHIGAHFADAAKDRGLSYRVCDTGDAWRAPRWLARVTWRLLEKRAPRMRSYAASVERVCAEAGAGYLITTGVAPLDAATLRRLGARGVVRANYATDDPWNPAHRSSWFLRALPEYDVIFNPRRANMADFERVGCRHREYMPFAYDARQHFPESASAADLEKFGCDVAFVGGADTDRLPYIDALREGGLRVRVYGGYWGRHARTRPVWGGTVLGSDYRRAVSAAKVNLCLVRRSNRDGHVMRTYELAAMRTCVLAEDTPEHREIYGEPDEGCVAYFTTMAEMVGEARRLAADEPLRARMSEALYRRVTSKPNTYADRFGAMVQVMERLRAGS